MSVQLGVQSRPSYSENPAAYAKWWQQGIGKEKFRASMKKYRANNPEKIRAQAAVARAVKAGTLKKKKCCQWRLSPCNGRIEAHHGDYSKPLAVRWMCRLHHRQADDARRLLEEYINES